MKEYLRIYRDPNPVDAGGTPLAPPPAAEVPKTKAEWSQLAKDNPSRWMELTQERMDMTIRESRESKEKLTAAEQREKNLLAEIEKLKIPPVVEPTDGKVVYGPGNYPKTEDEWNDLFIERPTFANDLRNQYLDGVRKTQNIYIEERNKSVKTLVEEHPDMYVFQLDDQGKPKKDEKGKFIHVIDPNTNGPAFDLNSEKGKLWVEIWDEEDSAARNSGRQNVFAATGKGPILLMAEMERRLRVKGATMVQQAQGNPANNDLSGVVTPGVMPPKTDSLRFSSEEERALAQKRVAAGVYKSLEEYCQWRDKGAVVTFEHANSRPDFSRK